MKSISPFVLIELGQFSTQYYLQEIENRILQKEKLSVPQWRTVSIAFEQINAFLPDNYDALLPILNETFEQISLADSERILVPNMTLHLGLDRMKSDSFLHHQLIHPFHLAKKQLKKEGLNTITILGSRYAMEDGIFDPYFEEFTLERVKLEDIQSIDKLRLEVFQHGTSSELEDEFLRILKKYKNPLICCTELSMLHQKSSCGLDLAALQIESAFVGK